MEIKIASEEEAKHVYQSYGYIISIRRSTEPADLFSGDNVLTLRFDDIRSDMSGFRAFGSDHVNQLLAFGIKVAENPGSVLVHCHAGVSRSSAVAIVLLNMLRGPGHEKEIYAYCKKIRPQMRPNARVLRISDDVLELNGKLTRR